MDKTEMGYFAMEVTAGKNRGYLPSDTHPYFLELLNRNILEAS